MSDNNSSSGSCGGLIISILILWALIFGLPTPWGVLNIDILPPQITLE